MTQVQPLVDLPSPPTTLGACATLAIVWEVTAPKPGNVYRGADFDDVSYPDFVTAAAVVGPILERAPAAGVGQIVLAGVAATQAAVATNTNLGTLLLVAPLAAIEPGVAAEDGIACVLATLTPQDTADVYLAIRLAKPGGLGQVAEGDVHGEQSPTISLTEAMRLAADRDSVAHQYVDRFAAVFSTADAIASELDRSATLSDAIVRCFLQLLANEPDSLIARKCGLATAREASDRAAAVLATEAGEGFDRACGDFDFWLRSDRHRRNPGTSADIIAAALFVLLRDDRIQWPVRFS